MEVWLRWYLRGVRIVPCPTPIIHHYHWHPSTISRPVDEREARLERTRWNRRKAKLLAQLNGNGKINGVIHRKKPAGAPLNRRQSQAKGNKKLAARPTI